MKQRFLFCLVVEFGKYFVCLGFFCVVFCLFILFFKDVLNMYAEAV